MTDVWYDTWYTLIIAIIFNAILFDWVLLNPLIYVSHPSGFQYCTRLVSIIQYYIVLQFYS